MLTRAATGALVGRVGISTTFMAAMMVSFSFCNTHLESVTCSADTLESAETAARVTFLGGLAGVITGFGSWRAILRLGPAGGGRKPVE